MHPTLSYKSKVLLKLRIISGKYGGRRFNTKLPSGIRPTTDSVKESIFNILSNRIDFDGISVADLYAGSGALGIESLSRGASKCHFVDKSYKSLDYIREILTALKVIDEQYLLSKSDAQKFLFTEDNKYDLIFMDPPYANKSINTIVNIIAENNLLIDDGLIVCEHSTHEKLILPDGFTIISEKTSGETLYEIIMLEK